MSYKDSVLHDLLGGDPADDLAEAIRKLDRLTTRAAHIGTRARRKESDPLYAALGDGTQQLRTVKVMLADLARAFDVADPDQIDSLLAELGDVSDAIRAKRASSGNMPGGGSGGSASLTGDTPLSSKSLGTEPLFKGLPGIRVRSK